MPMNLDKFNQYSEEIKRYLWMLPGRSEAEYESYIKGMKADAEKFFDEKEITYYQQMRN